MSEIARRMPAEWESHDATWIAWPHHEPDWPGKLDAVVWVYAEIVRVLGTYEKVNILCHNAAVRQSAREHLNAHAVSEQAYELFDVPNDRVWLRDSAPTVVVTDAGRELINWRFNAWAKYDNYSRDALVGAAVEKITGLPRVTPTWPDGTPVVLEGGAIESDGMGSLIVTEECLLSSEQERNPGRSRTEYEEVFRRYLGVTNTIWLGRGCVGDDTHGHIDDIARFVEPGVVALAFEENPDDANFDSSADNKRRLLDARGARGDKLRVVPIPYPRATIMRGERLPASYLNFYIGNGVVAVPTFNDVMDRVALTTIAELFPDRTVVGIHSLDLVWGFGTLHCLSQQQPASSVTL